MSGETFKEDRKTPFYDPALPLEERIKWLLDHLTLLEKCSLIGSSMPDIPRLGIRGVGVGGEAAHGVQQRNDWAPGLPDPVPTTSFPQPIGMSASWDKERIEKAGEVTGIEARVIARRNKGQGLSRWAPTVDLERDPRWGRNEEGYGEDPHLTGEMAGHYILGMQGHDPNHLRCASTLKHFYANNVEEGRGYKNSTIDPRNMEELYLETFAHVIRVGHPQGVMTAYNKINGVVGMFNPQVRKVLKEKYGITHAVSDGSAPDLARSMQHRYGTDAEVVAAALKAGIDGLVNDRRTFEPAALEALKLGLITEEDLDRAIANTMRTKLRLGVYDRESVNPYDKVNDADLGSGEHAAVSLDLAHASLVLLKNDGLLPLDVEKLSDDLEWAERLGETGLMPLALIGPLGNRWDQDWYCGEPMYKSTLKEALEENIGHAIAYDDGLDRVTLYMDGRPMGIRKKKKPGEGFAYFLCECGMDEEPEIFVYEEYGDNCISLKSTTYDRYLVPLKPGYGEEGKGMPDEAADLLALGPKAQFDWFATGALRMQRQDSGRVLLRSRWGKLTGAFDMKTVSSAADRVKGLAAKADNVILALGSHPMIPAKEELDRRSMHLPRQQENLYEAVTASNPDTVLMLFANYPYILPEVTHQARAVLMSATGSQDMGQAAADAILGLYAPAGRLAQTWYKSETDLPPIDDYDIIGGERTYRYFRGEVEFPFGFGRTYTTFGYGAFSVEKVGNEIHFSVQVTNTGERMSDEVVQIYVKFPKCRVKRPVRQLIGFKRIHDVKPGETRTVEIMASMEELGYYDVIDGELKMAGGTYTFAPYRSSAEEITECRAELTLEGYEESYRIPELDTCADHYDEQTGIEIVEGFHGIPAVTASSHDGLVKAADRKAELVYRDFRMTEEEIKAKAGALLYPAAIEILLCAETESSVEVYIDGLKAGEWSGDTKTGMPGSASSEDEKIRSDLEAYFRSQPARYAYATLPLICRIEGDKHFEVKLVLKGDVKVVKFSF